jgi:iron complex outermembrane recepter protein
MSWYTPYLPLLAALFTGLTPFASAQTVLASAVPAPDAGVLELSPFVVNVAADTGYAARETLAGTRLRTDLRDVGASLTVLTPEFMQDLAATSLDKALLFTPSVDAMEGDNSDINRAAGTALRYGSGQNYSIRGFVTNSGGQDLSHDFFGALEPSDNYNLERVTLALGPNALLIGVGSPQGVAVTSTKRALLQGRKTQVQAQYDRWSSRRVSLDHNQPLLPGRLALRVNLLHDDKREFRLNEGRKQDRVTLGVTAKPFPNTTVRLNHEHYSVNRNVVPLMWAFDAGTLQWLAKGQPTVQFVPAGLAWNAARRTYVDANGQPVRVPAGVPDEDGFVDSATDFNPQGAITQFTAHTPTWIVGLPLKNPVVNMRFQSQVRANTFGGLTAQQGYQAADPWALYGLPRDANLSGGTRADPEQRQHGQWTQAFVEQKIVEGLFLEVGANLARDARSFSPDQLNWVKLDIDRYLPDGTINPGYLVPYAETQGQYRDQLSQLRELRTTLSYEFNLRKVHRWLGAQNVSLLGQTTRSDADQDTMRYVNLATVGLAGAGWSGDALAAQNILRARAYFVNGSIPTIPDQLQITRNLPQLNSYGTMVGANANDAAPLNFALRPFINSAKSRNTDDALSFGWQGKWFANRLVTVLGYREDNTKSYGVPVSREFIDPAVAGAATDPQKRFYSLSRSVALDSTPAVAASGASRTYGLVYHALPWLSLSYNRSSNFNPVGNASWVNFQGIPAPNSVGKTTDYGVRFEALQGRLSLSVTKFTTTAADQARNANVYSPAIKALLTRLRTNYKDTGDTHFTGMAAGGVYPADTTNVSDTWSFAARGYETTLVFNPSPRWRLALTGSKNENVLGTHLASLGAYLATATPFQGLDTWRKFASELRRVESGQRSSSFDLDPTNPAARTQAGADALFLEQQVATIERTYLDERATEGATTNRNGKYAANGLVTHVFTDGRLKGWSVGGNFRWRSSNIVGYERTLIGGLPTGVIDVRRPIEGAGYRDIGAMLAYERRLRDRIGLRVQLNVENLFNWTAPRLVGGDYDTEGVLGPTNAFVPVRWELRRPRNFILTTTLTF